MYLPVSFGPRLCQNAKFLASCFLRKNEKNRLKFGDSHDCATKQWTLNSGNKDVCTLYKASGLNRTDQCLYSCVAWTVQSERSGSSVWFISVHFRRCVHALSYASETTETDVQIVMKTALTLVNALMRTLPNLRNPSSINENLLRISDISIVSNIDVVVIIITD